ncbi:MAG: PKD domain-containing protein [Candidatus Flexifilum sp.]
MLAASLAACNLTTSDPIVEPIARTGTPVSGLQTATSVGPTPSPLATVGFPTLIGSTLRPLQFPTAVMPAAISASVLTSSVIAATPAVTSVPVNIAIISPVPGSTLSGGNVQVLGSASHPDFLQYQVEFGPDPNPNNLWYLVTNPVLQPVQNGLLGIWNTLGLSDSTYQIRLRVFLRDGSVQQASVGSLRVQNSAPTPVPSPTAPVSRPIAAFSSNPTTGQAPLTVTFFNQSVGDITGYNWNFGDGSSSADRDPIHVFTAPGIYNVTLTVIGPGGTSNVSGQITVQSASAPRAEFDASPLSGGAPLTVQFVDRSSGTITAYFWNFGDGATSSERNPVHVFNSPGVYNVFLTTTGPGGSSFTGQTITVHATIPTLGVGEGTAIATLAPPSEGTPSIQLPGEGTPFILPTTAPQVIPPPPIQDPAIIAVLDPTETPVSIIPPSVPEGVPPVPVVTISDTQPVQPNFGSPGFSAGLRSIYENARSAGLQPRAEIVSAAGDGLFAGGSVWTVFGASTPNFNGDTSLQAALAFFSSDPDGNGVTSLTAPTLIAPGSTISQLVDPALSDPGSCIPGESPIVCQARRAAAGVMIISVGYNDAVQGTSVEQFAGSLAQIVDALRINGTIPLLVTIPPRPGFEAQIRAFNDTILNIANAAQVPVINLTPVLASLPNNGLDSSGTTLSAAPTGAGDLSAAGQFGANAVNLEILRALSALRAAVFPETM